MLVLNSIHEMCLLIIGVKCAIKPVHAAHAIQGLRDSEASLRLWPSHFAERGWQAFHLAGITNTVGDPFLRVFCEELAVPISTLRGLFISHRLYSTRRVLDAWGSSLSQLFPLIGIGAISIISSPYKRIQCGISLPSGAARDGGLSEYDGVFGFSFARARTTVLGTCISFLRGIGVS